jgi:hypothetical protein
MMRRSYTPNCVANMVTLRYYCAVAVTVFRYDGPLDLLGESHMD